MSPNRASRNHRRTILRRRADSSSDTQPVTPATDDILESWLAYADGICVLVELSSIFRIFNHVLTENAPRNLSEWHWVAERLHQTSVDSASLQLYPVCRAVQVLRGETLNFVRFCKALHCFFHISVQSIPQYCPPCKTTRDDFSHSDHCNRYACMQALDHAPHLKTGCIPNATILGVRYGKT